MNGGNIRLRMTLTEMSGVKMIFKCRQLNYGQHSAPDYDEGKCRVSTLYGRSING